MSRQAKFHLAEADILIAFGQHRAARTALRQAAALLVVGHPARSKVLKAVCALNVQLKGSM